MMKPAPIYDDEYSGPRWRYQLNYRPLGCATAPAGYILFSDRPGATPFGTIDYPRELTAEEVRAFELTPLGQVAAKV